MRRIYAALDESIDNTRLLLNLLAGFAVALAFAGAWIFWRGVAKPIGEITRVTEAAAAGDADMTVQR